MLKIIGLVCIIISSTLIGIYYGGQHKRRMADLTELKRALYILRGEISFSYAEFPEALDNTSARVGRPIAEIFEKIAFKLKTKEHDLHEAWSGTFQSEMKETNLLAEDIQAVSSFGQALGYLDRDMQLSNIELLLNYIDMKNNELLDKSEKSSKVYKSLGLLCGLLLCIALI